MRRKKYLIPDQKSVTYGYSAEDIALLCSVSLRTACRWKSGAVAMPAASKMILAGDLGIFDPEWSGWVIRRNKLISPEGWEITVNDVLGARLHETRLSVMQREVRILKAQVADLERGGYEDQPTPDELGEIQIRIG